MYRCLSFWSCSAASNHSGLGISGYRIEAVVCEFTLSFKSHSEDAGADAEMAIIDFEDSVGHSQVFQSENCGNIYTTVCLRFLRILFTTASR